jgi:uncharacterized membrane protein
MEDLQKYQYPKPGAGKTIIDTIEGLATIEPQHSPLYFAIARYWVEWMGSSVYIIRSLSVLISLLIFPGIYWLCLELFQSPIVGAMTVILLAVSPFHLVYGQEARPYSLWTVTILMSCASCLRALRLQTQTSWMVYTLSVILSLYTFLLSILVHAGQVIYIAISPRFQGDKRLKAYLISSGLGYLLFLPWLYLVLTKVPEIEAQAGNFRTQRLPLAEYSLQWLHRLTLFFFDFNLKVKSSLVYLIPAGMMALALLILVGSGIYFMVKTSSKRVWLFVITLIFTPAIALTLPDLIWGGQRGINARYLIPSYLGIQLTVGYLLGTKLANLSAGLRQKKVWTAVTVGIICIGLLSCMSYLRSQVWWIKVYNNINIEIATIINQVEQPLVVSDTWVVNVLSLSHQLEKKVQFQLVVEPNIPKIPNGFSEIFLYQPSPSLMAGLATEYNLKPVRTPWIWQLTNKKATIKL